MARRSSERAVTTRISALTAREQQVLEGIASGGTNATIGAALGLSEETIRTHARRLYSKLGVHDRAHAVSEGYRRGLLSPAGDGPAVTLTASDAGAAVLARALWGQHAATDPNATRIAREALGRLSRAPTSTEGVA